MRNFTTPSFWECYENLPKEVQNLADKAFELLKMDPKHPSLHTKKAGRYWSARVGNRYRALAVEIESGLLWFWIGTHAHYDKMLK